MITIMIPVLCFFFLFFFFNDTATTEIYTLSLHDALPISRPRGRGSPGPTGPPLRRRPAPHRGGHSRTGGRADRRTGGRRARSAPGRIARDRARGRRDPRNRLLRVAALLDPGPAGGRSARR